MSFLRKLFGNDNMTAEEAERERQAKEFDVLKYDGVAALRQNALPYAVKCLTHALEIKDDAETRDYLAQALIRCDNMEAAYEQLSRLASLEPDNVRIWLRMADVAYMMENYDAMADACEKAIGIDSENALANYSYARAYIGKDRLADAIGYLDKAISVSEDNPFWEACLLRGQTYLKMGNIEQASKDADNMLRQLGDNEDALLLKARCVTAEDDKTAAMSYYGRVIDANPFCAEAYEKRAILREMTGDDTGAQADRAALAELAAHDRPDENKQG